jgi:hypothetical protein
LTDHLAAPPGKLRVAVVAKVVPQLITDEDYSFEIAVIAGAEVTLNQT